MIVAFFLALSLWGYLSGTRELFTKLEQRLRLLQDQLVSLQEHLDILNETTQLAAPRDRRGLSPP
jgi:hypothetical protein